VAGNNFTPALPGPYAFHKDLRITGTGSINASTAGAPGVVFTIDGASGGTGAFLMDAGAALIDTTDVSGNDNAGAISITATGAGTLAAGSVIKSENNSQAGEAGDISLTFGASSTFAGTISSRATSGTTGNNGGEIRVSVTGNLTLASTAVIISDKNLNGGRAGHIRFAVSGDMTLEGAGAAGALISAKHPGASNGTPGGNIRIDVGTGNAGVFTMQSGSRVDSGSQGFAGNIWIKAGDRVDVQDGAEVLAGQRAEQDTRGHGGRIFVTAGCLVNIFGTLSSQGRDPGADLVHVEGCEVHIGPNGLVESTGSAHQPTTPNSCDNIDDDDDSPGGAPADEFNQPGEVFRDQLATSSTCVEIWARHITIDEGGEVNANFALDGGIEGHGWIDIFSQQDIVINGPAAGNATFAVHVNGILGNDTGGDLTVKAQNAFVQLAGQALQANATGNGGKGGHVIVQSGGNLLFGTSIVEARGSLGGGAPAGGTIEGRSFSGALTGAAPGKLDASGDGVANPGSITLQSCLGTAYTGATTPPANVLANLCAPATPSFPAYVVFNPNGAWDACGSSSISGMKFNDLTKNSVKDPGDPGLDTWTINLWDATQTNLLASQVTAGGGLYSFPNLPAGTYVICEVLQAGWQQTFPVAGVGVVNCTGAGQAPLGYQVTVGNGGVCCGGQPVTGKDFGNWRIVEQPPECNKPTMTDVLKSLYNAPDLVVKGWLNESVQDAVDNVTDVNNDGNLVVLVLGKSDGSLGGTINQKVNITKDYGAKSFALFGCSVTLTGGGQGAAVAIASTATSANKVINGRNTSIFVMDVHGGNSAVGVQADGNNRYLRNEQAFGNTVGFKITGDNNTVHNGAAGDKGKGNTSDGIQIFGNGNLVTDTNLMANGGNGITVVGNGNQLIKLDIGDRGKGNGGDGANVQGQGNQLTENDAIANGGDGFDISGGTSGSPNRLKKNISNSGSAGSDKENLGAEMRILNWIRNDGNGNKIDNVAIPSAAKFPAGFPANNTNKNFAVVAIGE
jgi:hypothetical protein